MLICSCVASNYCERLLLGGGVGGESYGIELGRGCQGHDCVEGEMEREARYIIDCHGDSCKHSYHIV